jgi:hypothetical protein
MIVVAIIIILVLLLLANLGLHIFNTWYPPCAQINDYFVSARMVPNSSITELGSIPMETNVEYLNNKTNSVKTTKKDSGDVDNGVQDISSPTTHENQALFDAVSAMFPIKSQLSEKTKKQTSGYNGSELASFESEMEGIHANNKTEQQHNQHNSTIRMVQQDGYSNR